MSAFIDGYLNKVASIPNFDGYDRFLQEQRSKMLAGNLKPFSESSSSDLSISEDPYSALDENNSADRALLNRREELAPKYQKNPYSALLSNKEGSPENPNPFYIGHKDKGYMSNDARLNKQKDIEYRDEALDQAGKLAKRDWDKGPKTPEKAGYLTKTIDAIKETSFLGPRVNEYSINMGLAPRKSQLGDIGGVGLNENPDGTLNSLTAGRLKSDEYWKDQSRKFGENWEINSKKFNKPFVDSRPKSL